MTSVTTEIVEIASKEVNAYVLGEHGNSQFVPWSCVSVTGQLLRGASLAGNLDLAGVAEQCKHESERIVQAKGSIAFGVGSVVADICSCILLDRHEAWTISHYQEDLDCCLSLPALLGRAGVRLTIQLPLASEDEARLTKSGNSIKNRVNLLLSEDNISGMTM